MAVPKKSRSKMLVKLNKINFLKKDFIKLNKISLGVKNLQKNRVFFKKILY